MELYHNEALNSKVTDVIPHEIGKFYDTFIFNF